MNEKLINTAVKVENEQQARAVVALYELGGFELYDPNAPLDYQALVNKVAYICVDGDRDIVTGDLEGEEEITIDELAWDYGLAREWANKIIYNGDKHKQYFWANDTRYAVIKYGAIIMRRGRIESDYKIISTRPRKQPEPPQWPEKGSLPPIGVECEVLMDGQWHKCEEYIFTYGRHSIFKLERDKPYMRMTDTLEFRPIKSERDKFIDKCIEAADANLVLDTVYGRLYDAGARFND